MAMSSRIPVGEGVLAMFFTLYMNPSTLEAEMHMGSALTSIDEASWIMTGYRIRIRRGFNHMQRTPRERTLMVLNDPV